MSQYRPPLAEMQFVMHELAGLDEIAGLPGYEEATSETVTAILEEAGKFAADVLDPLNPVGDREGARWREDGSVSTPAGFKDAYRQFCELGWNGLAKRPGIRRPGHAAPRRGGRRRDVERVEHGLRALPDADRGRDRGDRVERLRHAQAHVFAEDGFRRVDRHDEPDRAAGRIRSRRDPHEGGAAGRRHATSSTAARSSSPTASTITPTTSSTWCSRARPTRRRAPKAYRCSWCRSSS